MPLGAGGPSATGRNGSNLPQQGLLRPIGVGDKMVEGLMCSLDASGFDARRHRFDALALARQNKASTV